ncbi:hypothetical protein QU3_2182 [Clostridioides difficile P42]|nr:hypothetical protein QU3_2182 [Clostridioides difficile P42]EQK87949.1 hypothetical protein QSM_2167 [Clostridioides difficile P30]
MFRAECIDYFIKNKVLNKNKKGYLKEISLFCCCPYFCLFVVILDIN